MKVVAVAVAAAAAALSQVERVQKGTVGDGGLVWIGDLEGRLYYYMLSDL